MPLFGSRPKKSEPIRDKGYWLQWAKDQMARGQSRWSVCNELLSHDPSHRIEEMQARSQAEQELSSVMLGRNLTGQQHEKEGRADAAIVLYEANLADKFAGSHPYERLRIIYTKRKDYNSAIRVCQAFLDVSKDTRKRAKTKEHLLKLQQKLK